MCKFKKLHISAVRSVYRDVVIDFDEHCVWDVASRMKKFCTKSLRLFGLDNDDVEYDLENLFHDLRNVPLKELQLPGLQATPKFCDIYQELFEDDSPLKGSLKTLYLPWAVHNTPNIRPLVDSIVQYTFQPTGKDTKDAITISGGGYEASTIKPQQGTPVSLFGGILTAFGYPLGGEFESVSWIHAWPQPSCRTLFKMVPAPPPTVPFFGVTRLQLGQFDFSGAFPLDAYKSIDLSSVRMLELNDCQKLPLVLKQFMASTINIEKLEVTNWEFAEDQYKESPSGVEAFLASFTSLKHLKVITFTPWKPSLVRMIGSHPNLESCHLSFGENFTNVGMLKKVLAIRPNLKQLGFRHFMFGLPWKHDGFAGKIHGVTGAHIRGFDNHFAAYAEVLTNFSELESLVAYFKPYDNDGTSAKPDPGSDGTSEETMYGRLSDRILQKIRKVASKDGVAVSKVATVVLHDKALIGEYDPLPGKDRHFKRKYKYHGTSAKMVFLD